MFQVDAQDKKDLKTQKSRNKSLFSGFGGLHLVEFGCPLSKFAYPSEKRRTVASTARMRDAERYLDMFWQPVDETYLKGTGIALGDAFAKFLHPQELERTSPWVEPISPPKSENTVPLEDHFEIVDSAERIPRPEIVAPRTKVETGSLQPDEPPPIIQAEPDNATIATPTIEVSNRAQKVFAALYYDPAQDPPGEIPWSEFLHAFASIGFRLEKQHGSAWVFTPSESTLRSIIFHEPHPHTKIPA